MSELSAGSPAPTFSLCAVSREGSTDLSLGDLLGKVVVLYFYPKDDTPGCTAEACSFRDLRPEFDSADAVVLGISPDSQDSHMKFALKHALPFTLLADPDHKVAEEYGVWKEKKNYGKVYMGIERTTFVIDRQGNIARVFPRVKVDAHAQNVLQFVKTLS